AAIEMLANFLMPFLAADSARLVHIFAEELQKPNVSAVTRLSIFYLFHHLLHQPAAAPSAPAEEGCASGHLPPHASQRFGDLGFYVFLVSFVKMLPQFPPHLTEKVLRCCCIFAERGFYTHEALRHLFGFVPPGSLSLSSSLQEIHPLLSSFLHPSRCTNREATPASPRSLHASEASRSALFACRALPLAALKSILRMPSVTKGVAYARSKLQELPFDSSLSPSDVSSILLPLVSDPASSSSSSSPSSASASSVGVSALSLAPPPALLSVSLFAGMPVNQLTECSAVLDRATRLTGQEYLLLQSSLFDLSALLQCMHEDFVRLRASLSALAEETPASASSVALPKRPRHTQAASGEMARSREEREKTKRGRKAASGNSSGEREGTKKFEEQREPAGEGTELKRI
ncbi:hypothetical protein TGARI_312670B, partial [Toxoplasma gondii ARI]